MPSFRFLFVLVALLLPWHNSFGQAEPAERNATQEEITGNWQLVPLPNTLQPKALKSNPWPAACQWYAYKSTGVLKSIDRVRLPCEAMSSAQLDDVVAKVPTVISWKYDLSPMFNKALVIITRGDVKGYAEYWEPHFVTRSFSTGGVQIQQGDILLYLVNLQSKQIIWIRHLRKLQ